MKKANKSFIRTALVAMAVAQCIGCSSTKGGGNYSGPWSGDAQWDIRDAMNKQSARVGGPSDAGNKVAISVKACPATGSKGQFGPYTCDSGCSEVSGCVHAWNRTPEGGGSSGFMFASAGGQKPNRAVIEHEVGHWTLRKFFGVGGHPTTVRHPSTGKVYNVKRDIIGGVRWPARVWNATRNAVLPGQPYKIPDEIWCAVFDEHGECVVETVELK